MKEYKELTTEEFANLTDEEISQYEKLICAQEGIKMLERPVEPKLDIDETKDLEVYKVTGFGSIFFTSLDEAKEVADCLKRQKTIGNTRYYSSSAYFEPGPMKDYSDSATTISISSEMVYTKDKAKKIETAIQECKEIKSKYENDLKEYNEACTAKEAAIKEFKDLYEEACHIMHYRQTLARIFYRDYLPIAEGNEQIAMDFLKKAYTLNEGDEAYVKSHKVQTNGSTE